MPKLCTRRQITINTPSTNKNLKTTIELIGSAIKEGSAYWPLRNHAGKLATKARPKDYLGQLKAVYKDFTRRWRYVRDPLHFEAVTVGGPAIWGQVWGADKGGKGYGDCDDATTAIGAALSSIGFPVRIATIAGPGFNGPLSHVYAEAHVQGIGWIPVDPVGFPKHGLGWAAPATRKAVWDLNGKLLTRSGDWSFDTKGLLGEGEKKMLGQSENFRDYGLETVGMAGYGEPLDFAEYGLLGFGAYSGQLGLISDASGMGLMEVDELDKIQGTDLVRTKMLEISPADYQEIINTGRPRVGCVSLADDGSVYQYQNVPGLGSWWKRLFKRIKRGIKRGFRAVTGFARRLISKLPGGKYLIKLYGKIHAISMKLVRPLMRFVGKYAAKLAPIAALIPGYGPAIAAGLYSAGKIANLMQKFDVVVDKLGKPLFKSGAQAVAFRRELKKEAHKHAIARRTARQAVAAARMVARGIPLRASTAAHAGYMGYIGAI